jgi:UPF0716 protein FxsA
MLAVVLFIAFIVVPILEIYVIVRVDQLIGLWPTVALLLGESALGAWLVKREGARAWQALRQALNTGRLPSRQLADAALVVVGGSLLLTPGFITDVVGFAFVLPSFRPIARRILAWLLMSRLFAGTRIGRAVGAARAARSAATYRQAATPPPAPAAPGTDGARPGASAGPPPTPPARGRVVDGEVVEDEGSVT